MNLVTPLVCLIRFSFDIYRSLNTVPPAKRGVSLPITTRFYDLFNEGCAEHERGGD